MEFIKKGPESATELSDYLYPIWHEVFDQLMPWDEAEYVFRAWTTPDKIVKAMSEGYEFGYVLDDGVRLGLYSYRIQDDGRFYINKLYFAHQANRSISKFDRFVNDFFKKFQKKIKSMPENRRRRKKIRRKTMIYSDFFAKSLANEKY